MGRLDGKIAMVTGAGGEHGLGRAIARRFADEGGKTRVTSRTEFATSEALKQVLDMGVVQGATETWDRLAAYLASRPA